MELYGDTEVAQAARRVRDRLWRVDRVVRISLQVDGWDSSNPALGGLQLPYATGGPVYGPSGVDQVPARLTAGEHVWTVPDVQAAGGHRAMEAMRAAVLAGSSQYAVS